MKDLTELRRLERAEVGATGYLANWSFAPGMVQKPVAAILHAGGLDD